MYSVKLPRCGSTNSSESGSSRADEAGPQQVMLLLVGPPSSYKKAFSEGVQASSAEPWVVVDQVRALGAMLGRFLLCSSAMRLWARSLRSCPGSCVCPSLASCSSRLLHLPAFHCWRQLLPASMQQL